MHKAYLINALTLAKERSGCCAPNPCVGAIIVKNNRIIAEGSHLEAGAPHAEIIAIKQANKDTKGATLYVTLEPCAHSGRTPPCVDAIIKGKFNHVFFAYRDPNPDVCGNGQHALQQAGITCEQYPVAEIDQFYQAYHYWSLNKKPWVTIKLALSLDGKIAFANKPATISGAKANRLTHQLRRYSDAILTTINTVLIDNPRLNARCGHENIAKNIYVLDSQLRMPLTATLTSTAKSITLLHDRLIPAEKKLPYQQRGIRCIGIQNQPTGLVLHEALQHIGLDGVHHLWVEAGSKCFNALLTQQLVHEVYLYIATTLLGQEAKPAFEQLIHFTTYFQHSRWEQLDEDLIWHFSNALACPTAYWVDKK